jgi:hypothetical protein
LASQLNVTYFAYGTAVRLREFVGRTPWSAAGPLTGLPGCGRA